MGFSQKGRNLAAYKILQKIWFYEKSGNRMDVSVDIGLLFRKRWEKGEHEK